MSVKQWTIEIDNQGIRENVGILSSFLFSKTQTNIINIALDGTHYIQSVGDASNNATITITVSAENRNKLIDAQVFVKPLIVYYKDVRYVGYIAQLPTERPIIAGRWYALTFILLIESMEMSL